MPELFKLFGKYEVRGNETGVGLGLAISQRLASEFWINLAKEDIAESPEKRGRNQVKTTLIKNFPKSAATPKLRNASACNIAPKNVIIVDDDLINQMEIVKYLSAIEALHIDKVCNGLEALNLVNKRAQEHKFFDVIFYGLQHADHGRL